MENEKLDKVDTEVEKEQMNPHPINRTAEAPATDSPIPRTATADLVVDAGWEFLDIMKLLTNEKDNKAEAMAFLKEAIEAGKAGWQLKEKLTKTEYDDALIVIGSMIAGDIAANRVEFADGSKIQMVVTRL